MTESAPTAPDTRSHQLGVDASNPVDHYDYGYERENGTIDWADRDGDLSDYRPIELQRDGYPYLPARLATSAPADVIAEAERALWASAIGSPLVRSVVRRHVQATTPVAMPTEIQGTFSGTVLETENLVDGSRIIRLHVGG